MSISNVVSWWEEWQLRILVLGSLAIQLYLAFSAPYRKWPGLRKFYRLTIWVSYLGGDALAIYALATLFNRQKKIQYSPSVNDGSHDLEVLWAPILLMHLGGRMTMSAYNIEDNELWLRHVGVAISQVAVTLYVFCKSWSHSADKTLLAAAILLFILGISRCFEKPIALRRSSFNVLVTYFLSAQRTKSSNDREVELEKYIQEAREIIVQKSNKQQQQSDDGPPPALDKAEEQLPSSKKKKKDVKLAHMDKLSMPDKLFVDYVYKYDARLENLKSLWLLDQEKERFEALQLGLSKTFNLIYTKMWQRPDQNRATSSWATFCSLLLWNGTLTLFPASIVLFHISHNQVYKESDIKVTYLLLYITFVSEMLCIPGRILFLELFYNYIPRKASIRTPRLLFNSYLLGFLFPVISVAVAQHSLVGVLADKRIRMPLLSCVPNRCKGFARQHLGRSYSSVETSISIIELVHAHVRDGWMKYIRDVESYWKFSDIRGHWTLERNNKCQEIVILRDSVEKPLDESIILWHLATYFCFHQKAESIETKSVSECASMCKCISNYMMHLLSTNPEMLLPGSRAALFQDVCEELDAIAIPKWPTWDRSDDEKQVTEKVIEKAADKSQDGFLHYAWVLAQGLMQLADGDDGKEMWQVIQGVWVEMLCFSAYRCRGYLHAKSLAYGGEFLTVVSLLMSHAGLETFAERQQRVQLRLPNKDVRQEKDKQITVEKKARSIITLGETAASASASASQGECTTVPAMEVVVVTS